MKILMIALLLSTSTFADCTYRLKTAIGVSEAMRVTLQQELETKNFFQDHESLKTDYLVEVCAERFLQNERRKANFVVLNLIRNEEDEMIFSKAQADQKIKTKNLLKQVLAQLPDCSLLKD